MNDQMPMFDDPVAPAEQPPKKPRLKPMRKKRKATKLFPKKPTLKKLRKRRTVKSVEQHAGGKYPKHVYDVIGTLMNLEIPLRNFVMEVAKALTK